MIVSLFATTDNSLMIQDAFPLDEALSQLIALEIPYYFFTKKVLANLTLIRTHWLSQSILTMVISVFTARAYARAVLGVVILSI